MGYESWVKRLRGVYQPHLMSVYVALGRVNYGTKQNLKRVKIR